MTRAEFYAKYGEVEVTFATYYKFTFIYKATLTDGRILSVGYGGNSDEIYRHEVLAGQAVKVSRLEPYSGDVYKDSIHIEGFYDY